MNEKEIKIKLRDQLVHELPVLRARLGISQQRLADSIGVSRQTYNSMETGRREIPWTVCLALLTVFQSNAETRHMLSQIDGMLENMEKVTSLSDEETHVVTK